MIVRILVPPICGGGFISVKCEPQWTVKDLKLRFLDKVHAKRAYDGEIDLSEDSVILGTIDAHTKASQLDFMSTPEQPLDFNAKVGSLFSGQMSVTVGLFGTTAKADDQKDATKIEVSGIRTFHGKFMASSSDFASESVTTSTPC